MERISSRMTFFQKRVFPAVWFGFLFFFVASGLIAGIAEQPAFFLVPALMAVFGFLLMRALVWSLVDEVYDGGSFLPVRNRGDEERIALTNIVNVSATIMVNPPRITLR